MKYTFECLQENADLARFLLFQNFCELQDFRQKHKEDNPLWRCQQEIAIRGKVINADIYIHAWNKCDFARCEKIIDEGLTTEIAQ